MIARRAPLRVAIVGYGTVGPLHALAYQTLARTSPALQRRPQVVLVVDRDTEACARARDEWSVPALPPGRRLWDEFEVDIVDCCVPSELHASVCSDALSDGRSVLCEKPLTGSGEESAALVALAEDRRSIFGVNFNFRFVPALREARRMVKSGALGGLRSVRVEYHRSSNLVRYHAGPSPVGGSRGALFDLGPHVIDLVQFLFGPVTKVAARTHSYDSRVPLVDDVAKLECVLDDGALGSVETSKITSGAANDLQVFAYGTEGAIRFSSAEPDVLNLFRGVAYTAAHQRLRFGMGGPGEEIGVIPPETGSSVLAWHSASLAAFARRVAGDDVPIASAQDGLAVDRVLDAACISVAESSRWVPITAH